MTELVLYQTGAGTRIIIITESNCSLNRSCSKCSQGKCTFCFKVNMDYVCCLQNIVAYMESIGYLHSSYSLLLPFPRRCISDTLDSSLSELGIVSDSTLIVDLND